MSTAQASISSLFAATPASPPVIMLHQSYHWQLSLAKGIQNCKKASKMLLCIKWSPVYHPRNTSDTEKSSLTYLMIRVNWFFFDMSVVSSTITARNGVGARTAQDRWWENCTKFISDFQLNQNLLIIRANLPLTIS